MPHGQDVFSLKFISAGVAVRQRAARVKFGVHWGTLVES